MKKKQYKYSVGFGQRRHLGPFSVRVEEDGQVFASVSNDSESKPENLGPAGQKQYGDYTLCFVEKMGRKRQVHLTLAAPVAASTT